MTDHNQKSIEAEALEHVKQVGGNNACYDSYIAGRSKSISRERELEEALQKSQPTAGELYRWVKASERLPIRRQQSQVKLYSGGMCLRKDEQDATGFFVSYDNKMFCEYFIRDSDSCGGEGTMPEDEFHRIEWLEKLPSQPVQHQQDERREPKINEVWQYLGEGGTKFVVTDSKIQMIKHDPNGYQFICSRPHEDEDFSYACSFPFCRCSD